MSAASRRRNRLTQPRRPAGQATFKRHRNLSQLPWFTPPVLQDSCNFLTGRKGGIPPLAGAGAFGSAGDRVRQCG